MKNKRVYKGRTIIKVDGGYLAERQSDYHLAPEKYRLLRDAKKAIDNGEADLTPKDIKAREYRAGLKYGWIKIETLERMVWLKGDKAAEMVLQEIEKK